MRVKATMPGYYGHKRYKVGEEIILKDIKGKTPDRTTGKLVDHVFKAKDQFSEKWMELVDAGYESDEDEVVEAPAKKKPIKKNKGLELDVI